MNVNISYLILVLVITLVSMIVHEIMHGVVAYWLGDKTAKLAGRLTLNPIKHLDPVLSLAMPLLLAMSGGPVFGGAKPVPINTRNLRYGEWGFALVAIAGPITNFLLALFGFLIAYFTGALVSPGFWSTLSVNWVVINLGFAVFNIIPIPPLDGSRVLYALAPESVKRVMEQMERWGVMIVLVLVVIFGTAFSRFMSSAVTGIWNMFCWLVGL